MIKSNPAQGEAFVQLARQRVAAAAEVLLDDSTAIADLSFAELLKAVAGRARTNRDAKSAWLLFTVLAGTFPIADEVHELRRRLELARSDDEAATEALSATRQAASIRGVWSRAIRIVRGGTIVDVDFCARNEHNTGIQRLVRETMSRWAVLDRGADLVAWDHDQVTRELHPREYQRVINWSDPTRNRSQSEEESEVELLVPFESTFVIMEVPRESQCAQLAAMAEFSGNRVCVVGYDAIPLVSADLVPALESERFARYLSFVKHSHHVFAISAAAANEFAGFASAVRAQGLPGPRVTELSLPVDLPEIWETHQTTTDIPLLLSVGSHEPRKNQEATLHAALQLWGEGLEFQLVYVGRGDASLTGPFDKKLAKLRGAGHRVEARRNVKDQELSALYHSALVTVFPSLHEGYGLPVAESLAAGTPVITSNFGSTAEIGAEGGCIMVDPRDDVDITNALRRVLTDAPFVAELRDQIAHREHRTWADYSDGLWNGLMAGRIA